MTVIRSTIKKLKTVKPDILIILGGPEVSFDAESQLSRYPEIDYIISGEGEQAVKDLSCSLIGSCPLSECASLTYRMGNKIFSNPQNMDDTFLTAEFPYRDLAELNRRSGLL